MADRAPSQPFAISRNRQAYQKMQTINDYCHVTRGDNGIAQLTITNAGPLNIMNSAVINGVREGLEQLGKERDLRVLIIRGSGALSLDRLLSRESRTGRTVALPRAA